MVLSSLNWQWVLSATVELSRQYEAGRELANVISRSTARRFGIMIIEAICLINCDSLRR